MKHARLALLLLLSGLTAAYLWQIVEPGIQPEIWNISQAMLIVLMLTLIIIAYNTLEIVLTCLLLAVSQLMVAGCSIAFLVSPWVMLPGDELCSTRFNLPLGLLGATFALTLVLQIVRNDSK